jgi:hypothetical protein
VSSDQRGGQVFALIIHSLRHHCYGLNGGNVSSVQIEKQRILAVGVILLNFLDRIDNPVEPNKPNDVPGDASG